MQTRRYDSKAGRRTPVHMCLALVILVAGSAVEATTATSTATPTFTRTPTPAGFRITGTVAEFPPCDGRMRGVRVKLDGMESTTTSVGPDGGAFVFENVPPGEHRIVVPGCNPFGCWEEVVVQVTAEDVSVRVCMTGPTPTPTPTVTPDDSVPCAGDCDGDGEVTIGELITGVQRTLDPRLPDTCPGLDRNADGLIDIAELITAIGNALAGCPAPGALPDLVPTWVRPSEYVEPPNLPDDILVCVRNQGSASSGPFLVRVWFFGPEDFVEFPGLLPGEEHCEPTLYEFYDVEATVDVAGDIPEENEENNRAEFYVPIP